MKLFNKIQRGLEAMANADQPRKYQAAGKLIVCSHCAGEIFGTPAGAIGVFSGWALQCTNCGHLEFFGKEPTALP